MLHIESKEQFAQEIQSGKVIVDFYASWCGPCRMLSPLLEKLEEESDVKVIKVNVDEQIEIASEFLVSSIPFLVFFKDGKRVGDHLGYIPEPQLKKLCEQYFN